MDTSRNGVMTSLRFAGLVQRYHTWPTLRKQTIAEHTWHMLRLYHQIWGELPTHIVLYILYHDVGELHLGDLPYPAKKAVAGLKERCDALEAMGRGLLNATLPALTPHDLLQVKIVDLLEMWEFGKQELGMGNLYAQCIVDDTYNDACDLIEKLGKEPRLKVERYVIQHNGV